MTYDHDFWYTCVKWWFLQAYFSVVQNFDILCCRGKREKTVQNYKKFCPSCFISQETYIIWLSFVVHLCKMIISPAIFFSFSILIFQVVKRVKGQKMVQNDKKFHPPRFISQQPYIIWFSFMVHLWKMIISPGVFFSFSKFWFFKLLRGLKSKKWSKILKNPVCHAPCLRNHMSCDCHLWCTSVKW